MSLSVRSRHRFARRAPSILLSRGAVLTFFSVRVAFRDKSTRPFAIAVTDSRRRHRIAGGDVIRHSVRALDSQQ